MRKEYNDRWWTSLRSGLEPKKRTMGCVGCLVDTQPHTCGFTLPFMLAPRRGWR